MTDPSKRPGAAPTDSPRGPRGSATQAASAGPASAAAPVDPRQTILARRARFVAAALASAGLAASLKGCAPCLSMVAPAASSEATEERLDAGADLNAEATATGADEGAVPDAAPEPEPCLHPEICLSDMLLEEETGPAVGDPTGT